MKLGVMKMDAFCFTILAEKIDNNPEFKDKIIDI